VAIPIYNGYLIMGYSTIYTNLPVLSLILDEDVDLMYVMNFPPLYKSLQKGRSLNFKTFLIWVWKSIFQGCVIMLCSIIFFNDSFVKIVSITFTALIFIEILNVFTEVNRVKFKMILAVIVTIITYILSILLFRNYFELSTFTMDFMLKVGIITAICWLPLHLLKKIIEKISPSEEAKVKNN
jgi:phospholipid-translocating ATPase